MSEHDLIIGKRAVIEALKSKMPATRLLIADNIERDSLVKDILRKAKAQCVDVCEVPRRKIESLCSFAPNLNHQGVVLETKPYDYASLSDIISNANAAHSENGGSALVVICDHITDAGNLGAIVRSAESVGASGVIIPNKRSAHVNASTYKTSAGAVSHMKIAQVANLKAAIESLKEAGFWIVAATEHADDLLWDTDMEGRIAIIMGNEQSGVSDLLLKNSDFLCKLPQAGEISSLNVAQAATVFMYEWLRQNQ